MFIPTAKDPTEIEINGRKFIISKIPSRAAREIFTQYIPSALPKVGDYKRNAELGEKMVGYVWVETAPDVYQQLVTGELIDNFTGDFVTLLKLEAAITEYNCGFLQDGSASTFLSSLWTKAQEFAIETLTLYSERSSQKEKPPSENSTPSTV